MENIGLLMDGFGHILQRLGDSAVRVRQRRAVTLCLSAALENWTVAALEK